MIRLSIRTAILLSAALGLSSRMSLAADPLPKADEVINDYIKATGGKAAYEKFKNRISKGTLEITGAGLKGTIEITQSDPNKSRSVIEFAALGKVVQATDGESAWSQSAFEGDRVLEGEEKEAAIRHAAFDGELNWSKYYEKAECVALEDVDGKPAYKVVMTPKKGKSSTNYYDKASKLVVKVITTNNGPTGEITSESFPSDYKKFDGIMMPTTIRQKVLTQELVIKLDDVKHNASLPEDTFKVPAAIQELIKKGK